MGSPLKVLGSIGEGLHLKPHVFVETFPAGWEGSRQICLALLMEL